MARSGPRRRLRPGLVIDLTNQTEGFNIVGSDHADSITGSSGDDIIAGFTAGDSVDGGGGSDTIMLRETSDGLNGAADGQIAGVARISAAFAADGVAIDLHSQTGGLNITGSAHDDVIIGSGGLDYLKGNGGNDPFRFLAPGQSAQVGSDRITDFQSGDHIDLAALEALTGGAPLVLDDLGDMSFATGHIRQTSSGGNLVLDVNLDHDGQSEMRILLLDHQQALTASDFIL